MSILLCPMHEREIRLIYGHSANNQFRASADFYNTIIFLSFRTDINARRAVEKRFLAATRNYRSRFTFYFLWLATISRICNR